MRKQLTKEEFLERYPLGPLGNSNRVLVKCECSWEECRGWGWGYKNDLMPWETLVERLSNEAQT